MQHPALHRAGIIGIAALASLVFLHWIGTMPHAIVPARNEMAMFQQSMLRPETAFAAYFWVVRASCLIVAVTGLAACALAVVLAIKALDRGATRSLGWALALGALAAAYLFIVVSHAPYRSLIGWEPASLARLVADSVGYAAAFGAALLLLRFFINYPRAAPDEEWIAYRRRNFIAAQQSAHAGWRGRLYPRRVREAMASTRPLVEPGRAQTWYLPVARWPLTPWLLLGLAVAFAALDIGAWKVAQATGAKAPAYLLVPGFLATLLIPAFAFINTWECLQFHSDNLREEDRAKIDWIKAALFSGGVMVLLVFLTSVLVGPMVTGRLAEQKVFVPVQLFLVWPLFFACELVVLAFVVALAMSIFYRGAIDPRLAARKVTVFGVLGILVAFLFVLLERTVAQKLIQAFNLSPDTGALIAGAAVAASVAPVKGWAEKTVNKLAARFLPLEHVVRGERKTLALAASDLPGYAALVAADEGQAMLAAALVQRLARKAAEEHGGRAAKSQGDSILLAFESAQGAVAALRALHLQFGPAAQQLGLAAIAPRSAAHLGEVLQAHDGEVHGRAVLVAARLLESAQAGEIVMSDLFARAAELAPTATRPLGPRSLDSVAEPLECVALA